MPLHICFHPAVLMVLLWCIYVVIAGLFERAKDKMKAGTDRVAERWREEQWGDWIRD